MRYHVISYDGFHFMDETEKDESGTFETHEEAVAEARRIVALH